MIEREERDLAFDEISYRLIDTLRSWMINEKNNLDGFIAHPEGHVDYNPYLDIDFNSLAVRSGMLQMIADGLAVISSYKQGTGATRSMHDYAVDSIPNVIWDRLYEWARKRAEDMQKFLDDAVNAPPVPLTDYRSAASLNVERYMSELDMYKSGADALLIVMQFADQPE